MNIKIDIEMTPEELRRFMGLPDVSGVQEAIMGKVKDSIVDKMREQGLAGVQAGFVEQSFKAMEAYQKMFQDTLEQATRKKEPGDK